MYPDNDQLLKVTKTIYQNNKFTLYGLVVGDRYVVIEDLGGGAFGKIYKALDRKNADQRIVALKLLDISRVNQLALNEEIKKLQLKYIDQEDKILRKFNSPHILPWYKTYKNQDFKIIVTKYCNEGTLYDLLTKHGSFQLSYAVNVLKQLSLAIIVMHSQNVVHRDLKPENIFIHNGKFIIGDFGLSKLMESQNVIHTKCGTKYTQAPQVVTGRYTLNADIFSLGCILFIMLCSKEMAIQKKGELARQYGLKEYEQFKKLKMIDGKQFPAQVILFLMKCLDHDPKKRKSWIDLENDPIFKLDSKETISNMYYINVNVEEYLESNQNLKKKNRMTFTESQLSQSGMMRETMLQTSKKQEQQTLYIEKCNTQQLSEIIQSSKNNSSLQNQIYEKLKYFHLHAKIAEYIEKKIIREIEINKLLDLKKRQNIQLMYMLCCRCFINMSYAYDDSHKLQSQRFDEEVKYFVKDQIGDLYKRCLAKFIDYSKRLTKHENKFTTIIYERMQKIFGSNQQLSKFQKFSTGIQKLDYHREQQIECTQKMLDKITKLDTKDAKLNTIMLTRFKAFTQINEITIQDLKTRTFQNIIDGLIYDLMENKN